MAGIDQLPTTLIDVLANSLILRQTAPYIPVRDLVALSRTNKALRDIIISQPEPWRYLDLTKVKSAIIDSSPIDIGGMSWRAERMDESLTEDDFYSGPLRGIFSKIQRRHNLKHVQTMVLDGLSVPSDLVREIVSEDRFNVKVLSIRECNNLNISKLQGVLRYIVRPTRPESTPKLKALYVFGPKGSSRSTLHQLVDTSLPAAMGVTASQGAQIGAEWNHRSSSALDSHIYDDETRWYRCSGRAMKRPLSAWPETLKCCEGLIAFDAVLCRGPRHDITKVDSKAFLQPAVATVALGPGGCESCATCPEQPAMFGQSKESALPLLSPPPLHSATVRASQYPQTTTDAFPSLILRCEDCLRGRWCERCNRWWCEDCYEDPVSRIRTRAEVQNGQYREHLEEDRWDALTANRQQGGSAIKVYSKLCVEHCLVGEMMSGAGSNGMWG